MSQEVKNLSVFTDEIIINKIYFIRGLKVMIDEDLAELYRVETKQLKRQVRRNIDRFPKDFMFELSEEEFQNLRSQVGTSSWGGSRYAPMVFTEQGVAMLSGILTSKTAIQVHIQIIRVFTKMKELLLNNKNILLKLENLEKDVKEDKQNIAAIFEALKGLLNPPPKPRKRIGFKPDDL